MHPNLAINYRYYPLIIKLLADRTLFFLLKEAGPLFITIKITPKHLTSSLPYFINNISRIKLFTRTPSYPLPPMLASSYPGLISP